jgi:hypothetical protein
MRTNRDTATRRGSHRCEDCRDTVERCEVCRAARAAVRKTARDRAKKSGQCVDCPRKAEAGYTRCRRCRAQNNALSLASYRASREG